ncbi:MAG: hypothetical protein HDT43_13285 [Ruminococcaceae bacterium]|nr:hypothetical protein [Oscillospiraceae bacterium]
MYVLYVQHGKELHIVEELRCKNITAYCPRQLKAERRRGNWQYVERIIFTGYIFVDVPELTAKLWHIIMKSTGAIRFVSLCALPSDESEYISRLCNDGDCIDISRGYISDGTLHITSGFLTNIEHEIVKFNRRGKRAAADVTIYGEKHRIVFSVEFDEPPVLP